MVMPGARRSGLDCPPQPFQGLSWALWLSFVAAFYALQLLYTDVVGRAVAGALYGALALAALVAGAFATATDPADRNIYAPQPAHAPRAAVAGHLYCYRCERHVKDTSKHCTLCMKCIDVFDHHCLWLSNCVGAHNYRAFLALLVAAAAQLLLQVGYGVYVIVRFGQGPSDFDARVREFYPPLSGGAFFGLTVAITVVALFALALVLQLLGFHAYLIAHSLTTYDFIVNRGSGSGPAVTATASSSAKRASSRRDSGAREGAAAAGEGGGAAEPAPAHAHHHHHHRHHHDADGGPEAAPASGGGEDGDAAAVDVSEPATVAATAAAGGPDVEAPIAAGDAVVPPQHELQQQQANVSEEGGVASAAQPPQQPALSAGAGANDDDAVAVVLVGEEAGAAVAVAGAAAEHGGAPAGSDDGSGAAGREGT